MNTNTNGTTPMENGTATSAGATVSMEDKSSVLTIDEKLDSIMESIVVQQKMIFSLLMVLDKMLGPKEEPSKIIKPIGI